MSRYLGLASNKNTNLYMQQSLLRPEDVSKEFEKRDFTIQLLVQQTTELSLQILELQNKFIQISKQLDNLTCTK